MTVQEWLGKDNELGIDIWEKKYRYNNETFDEWLDRVSGGNKELRKLIEQKKFLFGGRTLSNRGTDKEGSFSNCYSRGFVEDNLEDLMQANTDIALTFKAQGGQGISLSKVRPKGCFINEGQFESDGIVPFMEIYNRTTQSISQGGSRKGALIMSLDIWHKEAEEFIKIKSESEDKITKANLSLEIDDKFMQYVQDYYTYNLEKATRIERDYQGNQIQYYVTPIKLYKLMMQKAYDWAEPGCIFTDRFRNYNLMQYCNDYQIETCNPCGEQPLPKHGACNLGSMNLSEYVINPFTANAEFDFNNFAKGVEIAIEALDTVLDENVKNHPLKEQAEMAKNFRNVGLGIMGMHDMFIKMGLSYGDIHSKELIEEIMCIMANTALQTSALLAFQKGTFPAYGPYVLKSSYLKSVATKETIDTIKAHGLRNCSLLSIAPTGSIGSLLDISTGCEPFFDFSYYRKTEGLNGEEPKYYKVDSGIVKEYRKNTKNTDNTLPDYFITASQIKWRDRILIQSILQDYVDTAISSTINLPEETTLEEIEQLYLTAWMAGLKGVTIYREGCKREGILSKDQESNNSDEQKIKELSRGDWAPKPADTIYYERKIKIGCGRIVLFIGWSESERKVVDFFVKKSGNGGCEKLLETAAITFSAIFRLGGNIDNIKKALRGVGSCPSFASARTKGTQLSKGNNCGCAIINEIEAFLKEKNTPIEEKEEPIEMVEEKQSNENNKCPECGQKVIFTGGCVSCPSCGYSKCS